MKTWNSCWKKKMFSCVSMNHRALPLTWRISFKVARAWLSWYQRVQSHSPFMAAVLACPPAKTSIFQNKHIRWAEKISAIKQRGEKSVGRGKLKISGKTKRNGSKLYTRDVFSSSAARVEMRGWIIIVASITKRSPSKNRRFPSMRTSSLINFPHERGREKKILFFKKSSSNVTFQK